MPYTTDNPPERIKSLPKHAQEIFISAFNSAWKEYGEDEERANKVAWAAVKKQYRKDGDKWIARSDHSGSVWIPVAKAGQTNGIHVLTREALQTSHESLRGGRVTINHLAPMSGISILDVKYDDPFLYMQFDPETEKIFIISDSSGRSIELDSIDVDDDGNVLAFDGGGVSVLYGDHYPSCTRAMGCFEFTDEKAPTTEGGITIMETTEIKESIVTGFEGLKKDLTTLFEKKPPESGGVDMTELNDMTAKFEAAEKKSDATATELTTLKTEFEQTKTASEAKDAEIADLKNKATDFETATTTEITALKDKVTAFEKIEADGLAEKKTAQFEAMLNSVPLGQKDTDEKKTALRTEFDGDPTALALKVMAFEKMPETGKEGTGFEGDAPEGNSNGFTVGTCKEV